MLLVTVIAWAYVRFGSLPAVAGLLVGINPVIVAVVLQALWSLGKTALKGWLLALVGAASLGATMLGVHELLVLFGAGLLMALITAPRHPPSTGPAACFPMVLSFHTAAKPTLVPLVGATATKFGLLPLFLFFLKSGSSLFGSGYVLLAFLRADLVERWHWLTESQLLDAVAVGQFTPGPVFTTATFIGYILGGVPSALVATLGIFLPAFIFVALSAPLVPMLRKSRIAGAALDGINIASLALMANAAWFLGRSALTSWGTVGLTLISLTLLVFVRVNSAWLVLGGALLGVGTGGRL